jgi:ribonuclease R
MNQPLAQKILFFLKRSRKNGLSFRELSTLCRVSPKKLSAFRDCLRQMEKDGSVVRQRARYRYIDKSKLRAAVVSKVHQNFGFATFTDDATEVFIPGKYFAGALPGDTVLVSPIPSRGNSPEGEVVRIVKEGKSEFTGILLQEKGIWFVRPDDMFSFELPVSGVKEAHASPGDKVLCAIVKRGESHAEHTAKVLRTYGTSESAAHCAQAIIDISGVPQEFPEAVLTQARRCEKRGILPEDLEGRRDLRDEIIFTIDGADSKDLDDAISIDKTEEGWLLGVHIADVSHYVTAGSPLDEEAFSRGTSIYFADRVIPMLPPELSNGICSLNPGEDRLAFSCFMRLSPEGALIGYDFAKTVIRSRVKGVYREVNAILGKQESEEVRKKYDGLFEKIFWMEQLADLLLARRQQRGSPEIDTSESYIVLDENSRAVDILPRSRGKSERIIEEFMLSANEAAATFARRRGLPFVYRVHEPPQEGKLEGLRETLRALGLPSNKIKPGMPASVLSDLLRAADGKSIDRIINTIVLRSMSKAKYFEEPLGHYGLALENYAQFTSPIRRYPDLTIHRILSEALTGLSAERMNKRFLKEAVRSARQSSATELTAMTLERDCEDCYKAEYMRLHIGESFQGVISSIASFGIYVELPNTVEGLVKTDSLPGGPYTFDGLIAMRGPDGASYRIGDSIRITCTGVDVSAGNIDFSIAE